MNDQAKNLRRKMELTKNPRDGKTIAVISGKGGVGKSNIALNFSLQMIKHQKKVIIIDLDVGMGNINILMGLQPRKTIVDLFDEELPIDEIIEKGPEGLSYIAGGSGLTHFFMLDEARKNHFFGQYSELCKMYDYIVFDLGAGVTENSLFFLLAADECIVVMTPEPTSITDAYSMIKHLVNNGGKMPIHVVLNRAKSQKEGLHSLERFKQVVYQFLHIEIHPIGMIPEDDIVSQSVLRQMPYSLFNEKSPASKAIHELTSNYVEQVKQINIIQKPSFVQKLKSFIVR